MGHDDDRRNGRTALQSARKPGAKLLTVLIRQDRFVEGGLNGAFEDGLLPAISASDEQVNYLVIDRIIIISLDRLLVKGAFPRGHGTITFSTL